MGSSYTHFPRPLFSFQFTHWLLMRSVSFFFSFRRRIESESFCEAFILCRYCCWWPRCRETPGLICQKRRSCVRRFQDQDSLPRQNDWHIKHLLLYLIKILRLIGLQCSLSAQPNIKIAFKKCEKKEMCNSLVFSTLRSTILQCIKNNCQDSKIPK